MKKSTLAYRLVAGAALVAALGWFAYANAGQSVDIDLGLFTLRDVSVPVITYGSVIVGMLLVVAVSWRSDLRTRQALKKHDQIAAGIPGDPPVAGEEVLKEAERKT